MASSDSNNQSKFRAFRDFMYDKKNGTVMGRTGISWAKIGVFYLVFYSCLAAFFAAMLALFFTTIDKNEPRLQGYDSLLKMNPGMSFEPQVNVESTLVRFQGNDYDKIKDRLQTFMKPYLKENKDKLKECNDDETASDDQGCVVEDVWSKSSCSENSDFGYVNNKPCMALTLNRIYGWKPEVFKKNESAAGVPDDVRKNFDGNHVIVKCSGENPLDKELLGEIVYTPPGFHKKFYPYKQQLGYLSPIVMIQFKNLREGVLVQVECKAYAKNIKHHRNDRAGSTHFEIISD